MQSAFENNHLLCYQPTIHNLILKICPEFQVLSSHFSEVNELLHAHWTKDNCKIGWGGGLSKIIKWLTQGG